MLSNLDLWPSFLNNSVDPSVVFPPLWATQKVSDPPRGRECQDSAGFLIKKLRDGRRCFPFQVSFPKKTTGYGFHEILVVFNRDPFSVIFTGEITNMDTNNSRMWKEIYFKNHQICGISMLQCRVCKQPHHCYWLKNSVRSRHIPNISHNEGHRQETHQGMVRSAPSWPWIKNEHPKWMYLLGSS